MLFGSVALLVGAVLLTAGTQLFGRGLERLLAGARHRPFFAVIIPGVRTAVPAVTIVVAAMLWGHPAIVLGAAVGAFVANVGLLLAVVVFVRPATAFDPRVPAYYGLMAAAFVLLWFLCGDTVLNRLDGGLLVAAHVAMLAYLFLTSKPESVNPTILPPGGGLASAGCRALAGVAAVAGGAWLVVPATSELAVVWHVSVWGLALTLLGAVAALPGLIVGVRAARNYDSDYVFRATFLGNSLVLLLGLGARGLIGEFPLAISERVVRSEIPVMGLFALLALPMLLNGFRTHWRDGIVLLVAYGVFVAWEISLAAK
jgi:cation:H+ antiporter